MPMMSKIIPIKIIVSRIKKAERIPLVLIISSETKEMVPEMTMVTKKIVTTQRIVLFRSFFIAAGSDLDTRITSQWNFKIDGSRQDKSYGLGRVVFHRKEPAVAAQAVSI